MSKLIQNKHMLYFQRGFEKLSVKRSFDKAYWPKAQEAYQKGDFEDAIRCFLKYLDPNMIDDQGAVLGQSFSFTDSSAQLTMKISDEEIVIEAPFVKLSSGGKGVAARRKLLILLGNLKCMTIDIRGNDVCIVSKSNIAQSHPSRLYGILLQMSRTIDYNDDFFIKDFDCEAITKANHIQYSEEEKKSLWEFFQENLAFTKEKIEQTQKENIQFAYALYADIMARRTIYYIHPHGFLSSLSYDLIFKLNQGLGFQTSTELAKKYIDEMDQVSEDAFFGCVFKADEFFYRKNLFKMDEYQKGFTEDFYVTNGRHAQDNHKFSLASAFFENKIYCLLTDLDMPDKYQLYLDNVLKEAASEDDQEKITHMLHQGLVNLDESNHDEGGINPFENIEMTDAYNQAMAQAQKIMDQQQKFFESMANEKKVSS